MSRFCKSFMTAFGNGVILCAARQRSLSFCQIRKINQQFVNILKLACIQSITLTYSKNSVSLINLTKQMYSQVLRINRNGIFQALPRRKSGREIVSTLLKS